MMILNKKWTFALIWALNGMCLTSCIDDEEDSAPCVPVMPAEADLVDSWIIEYSKLTPAGDTHAEQQEYTKQEGKFLQLTADHNWNYRDTPETGNCHGTWGYANGTLNLTTQQPAGESRTLSMKVYRLCSLRMKTEYQYTTEVNGSTQNMTLTTIWLRNR